MRNDAILDSSTLLEVLHQGHQDEFRALLRNQPEQVVDAAFEEANREERLEFLRLMPVERAASTFTDLPLATQADYVRDLAADRLRILGAYLGPDEVADLLGELEDEPERREYLLSSLPPTLASSALELTRYDEDDAGGIMTPEYVAVREDWSASHAIAFLRQAAERAETVQNLYLINSDGQLLGIVPLERLVTAAPTTRVVELARREIISAKTDTDQEEVARLMRDYDLSLLPIVDEAGVLKGIVTIDDVVDVLEEEATEDIYKGAAMEGSEIDYPSASPWLLWRKRVIWLAALSISEFLTVNVTSHYQDLITHFAVLSSFIAALIGTGGNTGSQSSVLIIRALSLGQLRGRDAVRVFFKELATGLLLGATLAALSFVRARFFYANSNNNIALTVATSVFAIVLTANLIGALLPIAFYKLKIDPALTSSPFIATVMDATGLIIYFSVAKFFLHV